MQVGKQMPTQACFTLRMDSKAILIFQDAIIHLAQLPHGIDRKQEKKAIILNPISHQRYTTLCYNTRRIFHISCKLLHLLVRIMSFM